MRRRIGIVNIGDSAFGMAAAALALMAPGPLDMPISKVRPEHRGFHKVKRPRFKRQADRSAKQYLLKGVRP